MARSTGVVADNVPPGSFRHAASGIDYRISRDGRVTMRTASGLKEEHFTFSIGSGAAGFSYLIFRDRYLFQAPITWYSQQHRWDAAPGYQNDPKMEWDRPVPPSCLLCHASQITPIYKTVNRYAERPFEQAGISCERCHGPGSDHIQSRAKMTVPSRLDPERRDDVCRQCHLMGEARIERPGRAFAEYRAGDRLADFVAYFVADEPVGANLKTTSHVEHLNASRCKQMSGDKLWCGTCHDVHENTLRPSCESCHSSSRTSASACPRTANCAGCHMRKSRAVDAGHGAFTDHRIARRPGSASAPSSTWRLRPFSSADTGDRELALAYAQKYQQTGDERQQAEAIRLAKKATAK